MKKHIVTVGAVTALLVISTLTPKTTAQEIASKDPLAVKAGTYMAEPYHTQIGFSISHFGFSEYSGLFSGASGTLELDPANLSITKLDVAVPVQTVLTTVPPLTEELKGDKWFDAAKFPNASFVSTKVTKTGNESATVNGNLTLHGVTKPVTLKARLIGSGTNPLDKSYTVGFEATGVIKRGDFGIKQYIPLVGDDVALRIDAAFVLQK
jgi:polyisoprenoid-binding protein YceI